MLALLFNIGGYRFLITVLQAKTVTHLEAAIDNKDYNETDLVEIRVTLNMPYQERYTGFERHYGEITIEGNVYSYVERKVEGDVLILKCIANHSKQELKKTADDLAKSNTGQDQENTGKKQSRSLAKPFSGDYEHNNQFAFLTGNHFSSAQYNTGYSPALKDVIIMTPHQPPRAASFS